MSSAANLRGCFNSVKFFMLFYHLLIFFFKIIFFFWKKIPGIQPECQTDWIQIRPGNIRHIVGPDLGPNCLQMLWADEASRQWINGKVLTPVTCKILLTLIWCPNEGALIWLYWLALTGIKFRRRPFKFCPPLFPVHRQNQKLMILHVYYSFNP